MRTIITREGLMMMLAESGPQSAPVLTPEEGRRIAAEVRPNVAERAAADERRACLAIVERALLTFDRDREPRSACALAEVAALIRARGE